MITRRRTTLKHISVAAFVAALAAPPAAFASAAEVQSDAAAARSVPCTADRTFHPDYSKALTPAQMSAAWQAELDRINPPIITGGG